MSDELPVDYGTDVLALDDLVDPEQLVSDDLNLAYALGRRLLTPDGTMAAIGDTAPYDSIDLRDWLGQRLNPNDPNVLDDLQLQCRQVLSQDPRVDMVTVLATFAAGTLAVSVAGSGTDGPFSFVVKVDNLTAQILRGT